MCVTVCVPLYVCHCMCVTICVSLYVCHCMCVTVCVSLYVCHCMCVTVCVSLYACSLYVCHCMCVTVCVSLYVCHCMCVTVSVCHCMCVTVCVSLYVCHCICVSLYLCVTVSVCHCIFVSLYVCHCISACHCMCVIVSSAQGPADGARTIPGGCTCKSSPAFGTRTPLAPFPNFPSPSPLQSLPLLHCSPSTPLPCQSISSRSLFFLSSGLSHVIVQSSGRVNPQEEYMNCFLLLARALFFVLFFFSFSRSLCNHSAR